VSAGPLADPGEELFFHHRRRKDVALDGVAAHGAKHIRLRGGFHRLGDDLTLHALDQMDHGLNDEARLVAGLDVRDQRRIELHPVERHGT